MRKFCMTGGLVVGLLAYATIADALTIDGQYWADSVEDYTGNIQNYGGTYMTLATECWVTGESDADVDDNGYAWDAVDNDYVAGWKSNAPSEHIIVKFDAGLTDIVGNDLVIRMYGGSIASASVLASVDNESYTEIGSLGSGTPGYFRDEEFDFDGLSGVHYIKVDRGANGPQTGMFFDSFASTVPEPTTLAMLALCGLLAAARWMVVRRRRAG